MEGHYPRRALHIGRGRRASHTRALFHPLDAGEGSTRSLPAGLPTHSTTMSLIIGGVSEIPDACVGDVITAFYHENGNMNQMITRRLETQSPLLRLGMGTRKQFPAGAGDIYTKVTLTTTMPTSAVGRGWTPLKAAYPGGPVPTCRTPQVIRYGHLKTQACLEKFSLRTQDFNAVDLTFKQRREQQWAWVTQQVLPDWSLGTQKFWYREAFRKNVWNIVLNNNWRGCTQLRDFVTHSKPDTRLTPDHLDEFYRFLGGYGANQTPYTGTGDGMMYHVLVTGPDEARVLDELDRAQNAAIGSRWTSEIVIPGYGRMRTIRNWVIMVEDDITRLGENTDGTYYEVEATREVNVLEGVESEANPGYYDPAIAKYTVSYLWNVAAAEWYVPPDFTVFQNQRAGDWNGSFSIINLQTPEDPKAENAYFLADFAFGMGPNVDARRAAVVLHLAEHRRGHRSCPDYTGVLSSAIPDIYSVKNFSTDPYTGRLNFEANANIPSSCPAQYALYLVAQSGVRAKISTVPYRSEGGAIKLYSVTLVNSALAVVRTCDPWVGVACLPENEPTTATTANDCFTCAAAQKCDYVVAINTDVVNNIRLSDGTQLNDLASGFNFPYDATNGTARTQLDTDLTTYLSSRGGGAVTVAHAAGVATVTITASAVCFGQLVGDAGALNFTRSNCVAV